MKYTIIERVFNGEIQRNKVINTTNRQVIDAVYHAIESNNLIPKELKLPYHLESDGIIINEL